MSTSGILLGASGPGHPQASVPQSALADIAAGLARVPRNVPLSEGHDPGAPRSIRLIATDDYDVWLITWPPGSEIGEHDHGPADNVTQVVAGTLVESTGTTHRTLRPGSSSTTSPHTSHRMWNASTEDTTTVHVYSPPLSAITYRPPAASAQELHPAGVLRRSGRPRGTARVATVRSRRAEASSALVSDTFVSAAVSAANPELG